MPLHLNKLDMRDYLWHAYGVKCANIRSFVQQQKVRQDDPNSKRPMPRRWYRGPAIKKMTVEMDKPFVWPDEPKDWTPYVLSPPVFALWNSISGPIDSICGLIEASVA